MSTAPRFTSRDILFTPQFAGVSGQGAIANFAFRWSEHWGRGGHELTVVLPWYEDPAAFNSAGFARRLRSPEGTVLFERVTAQLRVLVLASPLFSSDGRRKPRDFLETALGWLAPDPAVNLYVLGELCGGISTEMATARRCFVGVSNETAVMDQRVCDKLAGAFVLQPVKRQVRGSLMEHVVTVDIFPPVEKPRWCLPDRLVEKQSAKAKRCWQQQEPMILERPWVLFVTDLTDASLRQVAIQHGARVEQVDELTVPVLKAADFAVLGEKADVSAVLLCQQYGVVPIVAVDPAADGASSLLIDCDARVQTGTSFCADNGSFESHKNALMRALDSYWNRPAFLRLQHELMARDRSWNLVVEQHEALWRSFV